MAKLALKAFPFLLSICAVSSLQCLDGNNNEVDWYSTYKVPEIRDKSSMFKMGMAHYYLDVNVPAWTLSQKSINDSGTAVYNTLKQVYALKSTEEFYLMYNDERPDGSKSDGGGHTKGVVAFDSKSGFWLIHSVPKFPPYKNNGFSYPSSGAVYGQSFLCISLPYGMLGNVAKQLLYNEPHIYDNNVPASMAQDFPVLSDLIHNRKPPGPPWYNILQLRSLAGQSFTSFAKSTLFGKDLYADLVAPQLSTSLLVETWMDGRGQLPNNCSVQYKVYNVLYISLPGDVMFKRTRDHSKWATTNSHSSGQNGGLWTCIGDINRMESQFKRGGGTVCLDNASLGKTFGSSVSKYVQCRPMDR